MSSLSHSIIQACAEQSGNILCSNGRPTLAFVVLVSVVFFAATGVVKVLENNRSRIFINVEFWLLVVVGQRILNLVLNPYGRGSTFIAIVTALVVYIYFALAATNPAVVVGGTVAYVWVRWLWVKRSTGRHK